MEYNKNYVVILNEKDINNTQIRAIFDVQTKRFVDGSQNDLLEIYKRKFEVKQKFDVLAVPCRKTFVVAPQKAEEFKKKAKILNLKK